MVSPLRLARCFEPSLLGLAMLLVVTGSSAARIETAPSAARREALPGGTDPSTGRLDDGTLAVSAMETLVATPEGGARRLVSLSPVRWLDEAGTWRESEPRLAPTAAGGFVSLGDSLSCLFPLRGDGTFALTRSSCGARLGWANGPLVLRRAGGPEWVLAPAPMPAPATLQPDGSLLYQGTWPGVSERYRVEPGLLKHEVVLEQLPPLMPGDELVLSWVVELAAADGLRGGAALPGTETHPVRGVESDGTGGLRVVDGDGRALLWLPAPFLAEDGAALLLDEAPGLPGLPSDEDPARRDHEQPLALEWDVVPDGDALRLRLVLSAEQLSERADLFPLVIDPTIVDLSTPAGVLTVFAAGRFDLLGERRGLSCGDLNGDGHEDLVVAAHRGDGPAGMRRDAGELHVLLGPLAEGTRDLASRRGDVVVVGAGPFDTLGWSVAVGDLSGDGVDDLLVGAPFADGPADSRSACGEAHVLLGPFPRGLFVDLALQPADAVVIGAGRSHGLGHSVAIADVTGDGVGDAILGAVRQDGPEGLRGGAGAAHVVAGPFERGPGRRTVDLAAAPADAVVHGASAGDQLGAALVAGDLDGDGRADLAISSLSSEGLGDARPQAGEIHVLLAPLAGGRVIDLRDVAADAVIHGAAAGDLLGHDLAIADLSGDGIGDLIAGAHLADGPDGRRDRAGQVAVVFGPLSAGRSVDLAATGADVAVHGADPTDLLGWSVAGGDVSGDGRPDLLVGAVSSDGPGNARPGGGEVHGLLGPFAAGTVIDLALRGSDVEVQGAQAGDQLGYSACVADLTGDGLGDLAAAAKTARGPGESRFGAGEASIVAGRASGCRTDADCDDGRDCTEDACDELTGECSSDDRPCNAPPTCAMVEEVEGGCREAVLHGVLVEDPDGDELSWSWTSTDPAFRLLPPAGVLPPAEGARLLPPVVVHLAGAAPPCARAAVLTLSVSDGRGGTTSCHVSVRLTDRDAPLLVGVPEDAVASCLEVPPAAEVEAGDACDPAPSLGFREEHLDGDCPGRYRLVRTWRAEDACGNSVEAVQVVAVYDDRGPSLVPGTVDRHCLWPPDHRMVRFDTGDFDPVLADDCHSPASWRFVDCRSNQPADETGDGATAVDCFVEADGGAVWVRAERTGSRLDPRRYALRAVGTDACGNDGPPAVVGQVVVPHDRGLRAGAAGCR